MACEDYTLEELLSLVVSEKADGIRLCPGEPPCIVVAGESRPLQGPCIGPAETDRFLRAVANTRQMRQFWSEHLLECDFLFQGLHPFWVYASDDGESIMLELQRLEAE